MSNPKPLALSACARVLARLWLVDVVLLVDVVVGTAVVDVVGRSVVDVVVVVTFVVEVVVVGIVVVVEEDVVVGGTGAFRSTNAKPW